VATQLTDGDERGSWPTLSQTGMTGFSHGEAGIAYALLRYGCDSPAAAVVIQKTIKNIERVLTSGEYADLTVSELLDYVREPRSDFEDNYAAASLQFCARDALGAEPALVPALSSGS
jgi:hypothetical protein